MKKFCDLSKQQKPPESDSDQALAVAFNTFFIDKILKVRSSIQNSQSQSSDSQSEIANIKEYLCLNLDDTLETLKSTDVDEVSKIISACSNASATHDPFPTKLLRLT